MRRKYKLTGCARFFIFLLIFTPLVLIGVSIYHGSNPLDQVKELLNIEQSESEVGEEIYENPQVSGEGETGEGVSELGILKEQTRVQQNVIDELKKENVELKKQLKEKEREIQVLKQ